MDQALILICALVGWGFAAFVVVSTRQDIADERASHASELDRRDAKIEQLLDQVQLNAQNMPYYPQIGPFEPVEEKRYLASDDGLIVFEDTDAPVDEVSRV